jgi:hypothetical protein
MTAGALVSAPGWKSLCFMGVFFGVHLHLATWWGTNSDISGRHTAAVFGFVNSVGGFAVTAVQILVGSLDRGHWNQLFGILAIGLAVGSVCWLCVDARVPIQPADEPAEP